MTKDEIQTKWINALRSDDYLQGEGRLKSLGDDGKTYHCCLGVLAEICNVEAVKKSDNSSEFNFFFPGAMSSTMPPTSWFGSLGFETTMIDDADNENLMDIMLHLAEDMNDCGMPFEDIADWIEVNL